MREPPALQRKADRFHGVVVEAHIMELFSKAVGTFLARIQKPYFVDPVLYKFSDDFYPANAGKRWEQPLASQYGLMDIMSRNPQGLSLHTLRESDESKVDLTGHILQYQRRRTGALSNQVAALAFLAAESLNPLSSPEFLVAPYVYPLNKESMDLNLELARISESQRQESERLYAPVVMPSEYLMGSSLSTIAVAEYPELSVDGYLMWIGDFRWWKEHSEVLVEFAHFANEITERSGGKEVINLFGGYYSNVLAARGLFGATVQGVGISEYRDPLAEGGGGVKRYYLPRAHQSISVDIADDLMDAARDAFSCSCSVCTGGLLPTQMTVSDLANHFMEVRTSEFDFAEQTSIDDILGKLRDDRETLDDVQRKRPTVRSSSLLRRLTRSLESLIKAFETLSSDDLLT
jgi:hypothetical protein